VRSGAFRGVGNRLTKFREQFRERARFGLRGDRDVGYFDVSDLDIPVPVTLCIAAVSTRHIWLSTDHRLTQYPGGQLYDDGSIKHLNVRCPDGSFVIGYVGLGIFENEDVSDWMRTTLRGENRTVQGHLTFLHEAANCDLAPICARLNLPHVFLAGAYIEGAPWVVGISNMDLQNPARVLPAFWLDPFHVSDPRDPHCNTLFMAGAGRAAVSEEEIVLLDRALRRGPSTAQDMGRLLARTHRRAAESPHPAHRFVSSECAWTCMPPDGESESVNNRTHTTLPSMLFGIDATEMTRALHTWRLTDELPDLEERGRLSTTPRHPPPAPMDAEADGE
jgi:hypothetical protein